MEFLDQWYELWQKNPYHSNINFIIFIPLFLILRSIILKRIDASLDNRINKKDVVPIIKSLLNWGTFFAIVIYAVIYYRNTFWLGETWFTIGSTKVTTLTFIIPLMFISLSVKLYNCFAQIFLQSFYERHDMEQGMQYAFNRLFYYAVIVIAVLISLPLAGFNLSALTVFAGVAGIGIGFGMQNIISNFISGLILLFERPIKVGDRIMVESELCNVQQINIRSTIVTTGSNEFIIIPNSQFVEKQIINYSFDDPKIMDSVILSVTYKADLTLLKQLLLKTAHEHKKILKNPAPNVYFTNFGASTQEFKLTFWLPDPTERTQVKSDLRYRINELLSEHTEEIPLP